MPPKRGSYGTPSTPTSPSSVATATITSRGWFPPSRIKQMIQSDEDVGRLSTAVPAVAGRLVELFLAELITSSSEVARTMNSTVLQPSHLAAVIAAEKKWDFLQPLVQGVADDEQKPKRRPSKRRSSRSRSSGNSIDNNDIDADTDDVTHIPDATTTNNDDTDDQPTTTHETAIPSTDSTNHHFNDTKFSLDLQPTRRRRLKKMKDDDNDGNDDDEGDVDDVDHSAAPAAPTVKKERYAKDEADEVASDHDEDDQHHDDES